MSRAMTITPEYSEGADGQQHLADFSVNQYHGGQVVDQEYTYDSQGNAHYVEPEWDESDDLYVDNDEEVGLEYDYYSAVLESQPDLPDCLQWASQNLQPEYIHRFNDAMESGDPDLIWGNIEQLLEAYYESTGEEPTEFDPEDEEEEVSDPQKVIDSLMEQEPAGEEYSEEWQDRCDQYQAEGQEVMAAIAAATASFHAGECSADDAINYVLQNYNNEDVILAYQQLNQ